MFLFGIAYLSVKKFKLPLFLFILSTIILFTTDISIWNGIQNGVLQMQDIIGLLVVIPLISWVLKEEPYIEDIMSLFHKMINTSRKFYLMMVSFTQIIAYFLLFGSITMMYQFTNVILHKQQSEVWENYKGTAVLRGYALTTLWVISSPSFVFAIETLDASLWLAIFQGFGFAVFATLLAVLFAHFQEKKYRTELTPILQQEFKQLLTNASSKQMQRKKAIEFAVLFVTLFGMIFLFYAFTEVKLMLLIPLVIIGWVIAFYIYKKRHQKLFHVIREYSKTDVIKQTYQLNVMMTVGILIFTLEQTDFSNTVVRSFDYIQAQVPFLNPLAFLPFLVIFLGFLGLGPLTVMVLVAGILKSMALPYPPELIVLSITSGSVISILLSPLVMPVIVLSAANKLSLFTNGIRFNWKYALTFYVIIQVYLQLAIWIWT